MKKTATIFATIAVGICILTSLYFCGLATGSNPYALLGAMIAVLLWGLIAKTLFSASKQLNDTSNSHVPVSTLAVYLSLAFLSPFTCGLTGIPAVILGHKHRKTVRTLPDNLERTNVNKIITSGLVAGYLGLFTMLCLILFAVLLIVAGQTGLSPFVYELF